MFDLDNLGRNHCECNKCSHSNKYNYEYVLYRYFRRKVSRKVATMKYIITYWLMKINGGL